MNDDHKKSGERPIDADGRTYHSGPAFGEVPRHVIVGGSRARLETITTLYCSQHHRLGDSERDLPVFSAVLDGSTVGRPGVSLAIGLGAHGMGVGSLGCTYEEILWGTGRLSAGECIHVIRAGSCGSINPKVAPIGTTILVDRAYDEAHSYPWVDRSVEAVSDQRVLDAMVEAARILGYPVAIGAEITNNDFYRGQRRNGLLQEIFPEDEGLVMVDSAYMDHLRALELQSLTYSMEASGIFRLANAARWRDGTSAVRAGVALAVYAQRDPDGGNSAFVNSEQKLEADARCAKIALLAQLLLASM